MRAGMLVWLVVAALAAGGCAASEQPLGPDGKAQRPEAGAPGAPAREGVPADTSGRYGGSLGSGS